MELAGAVTFNWEGAEGARTIAFDELPLKHLHCSHESFIVVRDVSNLFIQEIDSLVCSGELLVKCSFDEQWGVQLFLQADNLLFEDQD